MKFYLAGPMRGIKDFNFPAFDECAEYLKGCAFEVVNPAQLDRDEGFDPNGDGTIEEAQRRKMLGRDMAALAGCHGIMMLPGWSQSGGAKLELAFARETGIQVWYYDPAGPLGDRLLLSPLPADTTPILELTVSADDIVSTGGEVRITDPTTGGQKGSKEARHSLIPVGPLDLLARVYGRGSKKYDDWNWAKGYKWSLSYDAMQRHLNKFWKGEEIDEELGLPHLACAAWHCFTLLEYSTVERHRVRDDRFKEPKNDD